MTTCKDCGAGIELAGDGFWRSKTPGRYENTALCREDGPFTKGHVPAEPAATEGTQEGVLSVAESAKTPCEWYGHSLHQHHWWDTVDGYQRCANCKNVRQKPAEPATSQTQELPPLDVTDEDLAQADVIPDAEWDRLFDDCPPREIVARQFCRERQLSAALTQLAALNTSRDALLEGFKVLVSRARSRGNDHYWLLRWHLESANETIAAAQQLQEDGK